MKYIADMLRNEPQLRCKNIRECLDLMADGRHVYIDVICYDFKHK